LAQVSTYPERHHPCFFLEDALNKLGASAKVVRDDSTFNCWGLVVNGKRMVWLIDNRHPHEALTEDPAAKRLLDDGVLVCHAQKPDMERVGGKWLPLAATPGYRPPAKPVEKLYDVGFVGYVRDSARANILKHVARHFKVGVQQGVFGDSAVSAYWQSKVGLNIPTNYGAADAYDTANMRLFEIMATGTPVVTARETYLSELGVVDRVPEIMTFTNIDYLIEGIELRLKNSDVLAEAGLKNAKLVQERHTYEHRAKQVLEWLK
jgi:glycosyltransferase involved in cell wall biosynthesis